MLVMGAHREAYARLHEPDRDGDAGFFNGYPRDRCPRCGSESIAKNGHDNRGLRRWRCNSCTRGFTPVTGTIFEDHKLPASAWTEFLLELFSYDSINSIVRNDRRSPTTPPYWLSKVFAVLEGIQDGVVLGQELKVQLDETYYPIPLSEAQRNAQGRLKPGLSENKICIAIACEMSRKDIRGRSIYEVCGRGKPNAQRAFGAYGTHLEVGAYVIHDKEKSHNLLVRKLKLESETHDSKEISKLPDADNPLRKVNRLCHLLKAFLDRHNGFDRHDMQNWLNLFHVIMNPPEDKMEKAALVLDRAMTVSKTLRYRDYYR